MDSHPNWDLKRIYADEGISGTLLKKRDDFNAMIAACEAGEYDLIVTKSVSRFARNLVDCVFLVQKLKRQKPPVGVYFETDNLNTLSEDSELMLSFLAGKATKEIAAFLTDIQCPSKTGNTEWKEGSINYILRNERYCGKVLTWKTFTADLYEHKHRKNRQDRDQYLYSDHHDAIVSVETFEAAQVLLENRKHHVRGRLPTMQVIDDGVFRGYVPINHHICFFLPEGWKNPCVCGCDPQSGVTQLYTIFAG